MIKFFALPPRDFWLLLLITFIESFIIFNVYGILMWILIENCGFRDDIAGTLFGVFGFCVAIFGVFMGPLIDKLMIKRTLLLQVTSALIGKIILSCTLHPVAVCVALFIPLAIGMCGTHAVIAVGLQRYIRDSHRNIAYPLRYAIMNVGAIASSFTVDAVRLYLSISFMPKWSFFIACNAVLHVPVLLIVWFGIRDIEVYEDENWDIRPIECEQPMNFAELRTKIADIFFRNVLFRRFVLVSWVLLGASSVLSYDFSLYPIYMKRGPFPVEHPENVPFMFFLTIDPAIVAVLSVVVGIVVNHFKWERYWVILVGTLVGAGAPFFMMIAQYWAVVLFVITMAVGESIWSPLYDRYVCEFTKKGDEGIFFGLAGLTLVISRLLIGLSSGFLLERFCPAEGQCQQGHWIWFIAGCVALATPVLLILTMRWTRRKSTEDYEKLEEQVDLDEINGE